MRAIITRGLYTFYPLFEVHLCTVTFGLMYEEYSSAVSNQEQVIVARVRYIKKYKSLQFTDFIILAISLKNLIVGNIF